MESSTYGDGHSVLPIFCCQPLALLHFCILHPAAFFLLAGRTLPLNIPFNIRPHNTASWPLTFSTDLPKRHFGPLTFGTRRAESRDQSDLIRAMSNFQRPNVSGPGPLLATPVPISTSARDHQSLPTTANPPLCRGQPPINGGHIDNPLSRRRHHLPTYTPCSPASFPGTSHPAPRQHRHPRCVTRSSTTTLPAPISSPF